MYRADFDENNDEEYNEVKILDFEYSGKNVRGFDLAGYIIETMIDYHPKPGESEYSAWAYHDEMFPSFDGHKSGTVNVDLMIEVYLTRFYEKVPELIPEYV